MKTFKLLKNIGLVLFLGLTFTACSSSDDNKEAGSDNSGFFDPKGNWKVTVEDSYNNSTEVYTFSTDADGISHDSYGDIGYTKLSYKNKQVTMTLKDYEGYTVPSITFDAPNPEASQFVTVEEYDDIDDNGQMKTFKSKITLERTSKSGNPNPNPEPEPKKSIEGIWEHSNSKYQLKIEGSKAIIYNLDHAPAYFPKKLVGDTFYDRITKTGEKTWSADFYQWRFTDDDYENGRWVNEGNVTLELSTDGNQFYQGTRTFNRIK
ncbi:hypothetical protein [Myroides indicus]|uniref:Lipocalin-like protein n=1 Tax=Myroides indicus TaxID=1323422 RepID=A0A4R7F5V9_9FLAO|nr:hypothetical protein [Myroides indicus]TDS65082.1 hypothetical protein C8P70_103104 [Myroides indicus]